MTVQLYNCLTRLLTCQVQRGSDLTIDKPKSQSQVCSPIPEVLSTKAKFKVLSLHFQIKNADTKITCALYLDIFDETNYLSM